MSSTKFPLTNTRASTSFWLSSHWLSLLFAQPKLLRSLEAAKRFTDIGAQVLVFASTDSEYSLLAWTNVERKDGGLGKVDIPLVADTNHSLSRDYGGVLIEESWCCSKRFVHY